MNQIPDLKMKGIFVYVENKKMLIDIFIIVPLHKNKKEQYFISLGNVFNNIGVVINL